MNLSIVIPLLNEEASLEELFLGSIMFANQTIYPMKFGL